MDANEEQIERYIQDKTSDIRSDHKKVEVANKIIRKLFVLKQLKDDVDSPIVQYFLKEFEGRALHYGKKALNGSQPDSESSYECKCGEKIDMNKLYYKVYSDAHDLIVGFVEQWNKANSDIAKASRR